MVVLAAIIIHDVCVSHVFYADDLCLLAPCAIALQQLLNICHSYGIIVDFNFNAQKSSCFIYYGRFIKKINKKRIYM